MASNRSSPQTIQSSDPQTVSSELSAQTPVTVMSSQTPEYYAAVVQEISETAEEEDEVATIEHVSSSSEDLEVLEASAEVAAATRREAEAKERLARAKARKSRPTSSRTSISSARFSQTRPAEPAMPAEPAQPAPPLPEPVLPEARPYWLDWFAGHATVQREHARRGTPAVEPGGSVGVSAGPLGSGGGNAAMHEREHQDRGHGMAPFMESALEHARVQERSSEGWELQHVRARVQELEALLELQRVQAQTERMHAKKMTGRDSQASFASIASSQPAHVQHDQPAHAQPDQPAFVHVSYPATPERERDSHAGWPPGLPATPPIPPDPPG